MGLKTIELEARSKPYLTQTLSAVFPYLVSYCTIVLVIVSFHRFYRFANDSRLGCIS
jgi:hypothetical protein